MCIWEISIAYKKKRRSIALSGTKILRTVRYSYIAQVKYATLSLKKVARFASEKSKKWIKATMFDMLSLLWSPSPQNW